MVSDATRTRVDDVRLDLSAGRVLGAEDEFTMAESFAQRWVQSEWRVGVRVEGMTTPNSCPFEVDVNQPRPKGVPPLLFNLQLHDGHGCATEMALREICRRRGYLKRVGTPPRAADADGRRCGDRRAPARERCSGQLCSYVRSRTRSDSRIA